MSNRNNKENMKQQSGEDGNICRDYKRGVCNRGNKCKFAHPTDIKPPDADKPPICRDFQNGTCDRNNCKYLHITSSEERVFLATGKLPSHLGQSSGPTTPDGGGKKVGGDVCKDFLNKVCNRGTRCKFRHINEEEWEREKRGAVSMEEDMSRKRKRENFSVGSGLDYQFLNDENDMLRRKVADLQRQVADLRAMNDTLYEQNMRYRSQLKSESMSDSRSAPVSYPGYPRERDTPVRYPRDSFNGAGGSSSYPERLPAPKPYAKDYNPAALSGKSPSPHFEGYTKF